MSSAADVKWLKNGEGELFEGTYHSEANADGKDSYEITVTVLGFTNDLTFTLLVSDNAELSDQVQERSSGNVPASDSSDGNPKTGNSAAGFAVLLVL